MITEKRPAWENFTEDERTNLSVESAETIARLRYMPLNPQAVVRVAFLMSDMNCTDPGSVVDWAANDIAIAPSLAYSEEKLLAHRSAVGLAHLGEFGTLMTIVMGYLQHHQLGTDSRANTEAQNATIAVMAKRLTDRHPTAQKIITSVTVNGNDGIALGDDSAVYVFDDKGEAVAMYSPKFLMGVTESNTLETTVEDDWASQITTGMQ